MIEFNCPTCLKYLEIEECKAQNPCTCPVCFQLIRFPSNEPPPPSSELVPLKIGLPKLGGLETNVSRQDAGRLGHTFLGGTLALLGVIVGGVLALKTPK